MSACMSKKQAKTKKSQIINKVFLSGKKYVGGE